MPAQSTSTNTDTIQRSLSEDDISLRDIYLIIRKNLWLLISVPIIIAVLVFIASSLLPKQYDAESVALITPTPISVGGNSLAYRPSNAVSFEAYQTLAESRAVLEEAVANVPDADMTYTDLNGSVQELVGPQRPDQVVSLLITHKVIHSDPELAAQLADSWVNATLNTVQKTLLNNLDPLIALTNLEAQELLIKLERAEAALADFEAKDNSASLELSLERLTALSADAQNDLVMVSELGLQNSGVSLNLDLTNDDQVTTSQSNAASVNLSQEITSTTAFIKTLEGLSLSANLRDELNYRKALLSSLNARQSKLQEQLVEYQQNQETFQNQLASLSKEKKKLERDLENARAAYQNVVTLQPTFDYLTKLAPSNAQLLNEASIPTNASGPRRSLNAAIAGVLAGFMLLLFVFIREAVSAKS